MSDAIQNLLGRLGITADGNGGLSLKNLVVSGQTIGAESATAVNTIGAATLTAAQIVTRNIIRGGAQSGSAFSDTTDTAANIVAALTNVAIGDSFKFTYVNNTNAVATIVGGTGVNSAGTIDVIPPNSQVQFLMVVTSLTAITFTTILDGSSPANTVVTNTTLTTVGAGTITAAGIAGGVTTRSGSTSAFADTTDTATAIIAAIPGAQIGQTFEWTYFNTCAAGAAATIGGGVGVTVSGITVVQPGNFATYLGTYTAAATITLVGKEGAQSLTGFNNVILAGLLQESTAAGLTALTGGQAGALALTAEVNQITTCTAGFGVSLPAAQNGLTVYIINNAANAVQVYGNNASADTIDGVVTGTGVAQMVGSLTLYTCYQGGAAGKWVSEGIGTGYSGSLPTVSFTDAMTANGTTNASTAIITTALARFTTVGTTTNNACVLPVSAAGMQVTVMNGGTNPLQVFASGSEQINGSTAAIMLAVGASLTFSSTLATRWHTPTAVFDQINQDCVRCTATTTATSTTTLATVTGLSVNVSASGVYRVKASLLGTAAAAGGLKAQLIATNSLSLTSANLQGKNFNGTTTNASTNITALAADFSNTAAAYTDCTLEGTIVVNAAGTLNVQMAQNTSNATPTTVAAGSYLELVRIS